VAGNYSLSHPMGDGGGQTDLGMKNCTEYEVKWWAASQRATEAKMTKGNQRRIYRGTGKRGVGEEMHATTSVHGSRLSLTPTIPLSGPPHSAQPTENEPSRTFPANNSEHPRGLPPPSLSPHAFTSQSGPALSFTLRFTQA